MEDRLHPLLQNERQKVQKVSDRAGPEVRNVLLGGARVRTLASMRSLRFSTIMGSFVNSSNRYCHSQVSWPNVPLVTKKIPLDTKTGICEHVRGRGRNSATRVPGHSPVGDHEDVGLVDLGVSEIFVLGVTSVLDFLRKEKRGIRDPLYGTG